MNNNKRCAKQNWSRLRGNKRSHWQNLSMRETDVIDRRHSVVEARHVNVLHGAVGGVGNRRLEVKATSRRSDILVVGHVDVGRRGKSVRVVFTERRERVGLGDVGGVQGGGYERVEVRVSSLTEGCGRKLMAKID